jgi:SAM-dependent methyltransferase
MSDDKLKSHFAEKYFDEIDEISEDENYFTPVLREVSKEIDFRTARVLDVGCGTGLFLKPVIDSGCTECVGTWFKLGGCRVQVCDRGSRATTRSEARRGVDRCDRLGGVEEDARSRCSREAFLHFAVLDRAKDRRLVLLGQCRCFPGICSGI